MPRSLEEDFLEGLWENNEPQDEQQPILAASNVIKAAQQRPTYRELAASGQPISTLLPRTTVRLDTSNPLPDSLTASLHARTVRPISPGAQGDQSMPIVSSAASYIGVADSTGGDGGCVLVDAHLLRKEVDVVIQSVEAAQTEFDQATQAAAKAADLAESMQQDFQKLLDEEAALTVAKPPAPERLRKVQRLAADRDAALGAQRYVARAAQVEAAAAEAGLRVAEAELDFLADARQGLDATFAADEGVRREVMAALRGREERAARSYVARLQAEGAKLEALQAAQEELKDKKIQAAEEAQEAAQERLKRGLERVRRNLGKGMEVLAAQHASRREALVGLKGSLALVREEVGRKAQLYQVLQKQKREVREREFQDLMEQGLNPYLVYRQRDMEAQTIRQRASMQARIEARQVDIASQLAKEEENFQRKLMVVENEKRVTAQFQREQGQAAVEGRVEKYMRSHTTGGQTMLDPTGRLPVDPSSAVVAKTKAFGAGRATQELLAKMSALHPDVGPKELIMPTKYRPEPFDDEDMDSEDENGMPHHGTMTERSVMTTVTGASGWASGRSGEGGDARVSNAGAQGRKDGWKQLEQRKLSKFERQALDAAKTRHRDALAAPKVMMGREFGGDAFMTTPEVVIFKDFEVGQQYRAKVSITNRSYAKNTYRVLEVPPEFGNVLEVGYQLPGYLAMGVSGEITITFTPKSNEDIEAHISLLAETGPFKIPVRCLTKKAVLRVSTPLVDFGPGVTLGESATRGVTLSNEGALEVEYSITAGDLDLQPEGEGSFKELLLPVPPFRLSPCTGVVPGYGRVTLHCVFAPLQAQPSTRSVTITYKSTAQRKLLIPADTLTFQGTGRDLPIFLEREVIDFKCVMVDHVYREKLVVRNGGKTAMKVSVANRPDVSDYFEFSPNFGFVQAGESFPITVLFKPRASILSQCARFLSEGESGVLEVPLKVVVPDQKLPVCFSLRAEVTTTDLLFSPPTLNFGPCVMAEDTGVVLRVTNPSALPQTFGFVGLPASIRITPNDGFGYILPGETVERIVSFQPPIPGPQSLTIVAKSLSGRTFNIPVEATGVQPGLSLSHNKVVFPATPVNDMRSCSVVLRNNTSSPQAFEFEVPAGSALCFIPHVGEVAPLGSMRVQINFQPQNDDPVPGARISDDGAAAELAVPPTSPPLAKGTKAKSSTLKPQEPPLPVAETAEGVEEGEFEGDEGGEGLAEDPSDWYSWRNFSVPCFIRPPVSGRPQSAATATSAAGRTSMNGSLEHVLSARVRMTSSSGMGLAAGTPTGEAQVLHLNIVTCAVQPDLVLRTELKWLPEKCMYELDFGPVPVGQRVTRSIDLMNQGQNLMSLCHEPLDNRQVYLVVAAWRDLLPGGRWRALLAFQPQHRSDYLEVLTINSGRTKLRIALKGQGIAPELKLEPASVITQGLDLGDVYKGESSEARLSVTNVCPFPLSWTARFAGMRDPNTQNRPPFFCRPAEGTLDQGEKCEVVVVFRPSSQRPYFMDTLQVAVPNQQEQLNVPVRGRGWEEGVYVCGPEYPPPDEDPFMERRLAAMASSALQQQLAATVGAAVPPTHPASLSLSSLPPSLSISQLQPMSNPTPVTMGGPGTPSPMAVPPQGVLAMAPGTSGQRALTATFPHAICLGEKATYTLEVGSLKSSALGGALGECSLEEVTPAAKAAGWGVDTGRMALAAGEKKSLVVTYKAPREAHSGMAALFGHPEYMEVVLGVTLKGGLPAPPSAEGRKLTITVRILVQPRLRLFKESLPPGVERALTLEEEMQLETEKKVGPGKKKVSS